MIVFTNLDGRRILFRRLRAIGLGYDIELKHRRKEGGVPSIVSFWPEPNFNNTVHAVLACQGLELAHRGMKAMEELKTVEE